MADISPAPLLRVGLLLMPDFTLLALAGFVDTLRLAADEGDRSRPVRCSWTLMTENGHAVRSSAGVLVEPTAGLLSPDRFDYLVVVGGTLHRGPEIGAATLAYLHTAAAEGVPLVGICTGGFALARAGLMRGRRCCISWFHRDELAAEFPDMTIVADELYVFDGDRITCAGGTSVVHLASRLVERHVGVGRSRKGLRVMLEEHARDARSPQPPPAVPGLDRVTDHRVRRAMLLIERGLDRSTPLTEIASAVGATVRHLGRLFVAEAGVSPGAFRDALRLDRAHAAVTSTREPMTRIAADLGFADAAHFSRCFKRRHGVSPTIARRTAQARS
jgi:transcriptional regulator GlxA family with amidase domain